MASLLSATRSISLSRASSSSKSKSKLPVQRLPELDAEQPAIPRAWKGLNGDGIVQSIPSPRLTTVHARVPGPGIERVIQMPIVQIPARHRANFIGVLRHHARGIDIAGVVAQQRVPEEF